MRLTCSFLSMTFLLRLSIKPLEDTITSCTMISSSLLSITGLISCFLGCLCWRTGAWGIVVLIKIIDLKNCHLHHIILIYLFRKLWKCLARMASLFFANLLWYRSHSGFTLAGLFWPLSFCLKKEFRRTLLELGLVNFGIGRCEWTVLSSAKMK